MSARVISVSTPINTDFGDDLLEYIAFVARVSNPSNQYNKETAEKLVRYLAKHRHWSPFEMANICLEVETTRDIARQLLRHRSFSFQEFSQRYAEVDSFTIGEARLQDHENRQNSIETHDKYLREDWYDMQKAVAHFCESKYKVALERGIAKEVARKVLPEGLTNSKLYVNGTLRSWLHYIEVRTHESTQKEHRELALECKEAIKPYFDIDSFTNDSPRTLL